MTCGVNERPCIPDRRDRLVETVTCSAHRYPLATVVSQAFIGHTGKNVEAAGQKWSKQIEELKGQGRRCPSNLRFLCLLRPCPL